MAHEKDDSLTVQLVSSLLGSEDDAINILSLFYARLNSLLTASSCLESLISKPSFRDLIHFLRKALEALGLRHGSALTVQQCSLRSSDIYSGVVSCGGSGDTVTVGDMCSYLLDSVCIPLIKLMLPSNVSDDNDPSFLSDVLSLAIACFPNAVTVSRTKLIALFVDILADNDGVGQVTNMDFVPIVKTLSALYSSCVTWLLKHVLMWFDRINSYIIYKIKIAVRGLMKQDLT
jgi:hypothetical protein